MSGVIPEDGIDYLDHYHRRLNELFKKNVNKSSVASSFVGMLSDTVDDGQCSTSRGQHVNGTLTTQQFYRKPSNEDSHQFQGGKFSSKASSSSTFGASDAGVFKKPLPVKRFSCGPLTRTKFRLYADYLCSLDNKSTTKFALITMEALVHSIEKHSSPQALPVPPEYLMDYICQIVKEEYLSKQVPKSICGSSIMSDQASNIDQYSNSERSIRLDRPFPSSATTEPRVALQDITQSSFYRGPSNMPPPQGLRNSENASITGIPGHSSIHQQNRATVKERGILPPRQQLLEPLTETESTFNLLNDSDLARMRDEAVARQESMFYEKAPLKKSGQTLPKPTPKPKTSYNKVRQNTKASTTVSKKPINQHFMVSAVVSDKSSFDQTKKDISLLNGTGVNVSRCGRVRKAPVKYWNSKGEEQAYTEPEESALNESMTLRNKKVVNKKKTPPGNIKNNTPLAPVPETEISKPAERKPKGRPPKHSSLSAEKENAESGKKKPVKKQSDATAQKNTVPKGKTNKKNEAVKQKKENSEKKPAPKRKSKESNAVAYKKKKIEDPVDYCPSDDTEDDLFGGVSYKKPTHQTLKVALSPSVALLSAKKAAGAAEGKATPPCKAIGDIMMNESILSVMSAAKEAPKQNEAVKRIIKKLEKNKTEPSKTQVKKTRKENYNLKEDEKCSYVNNSICTAALSVFNGAEQNSDLSDMEDEDDDDLM